MEKVTKEQFMAVAMERGWQIVPTVDSHVVSAMADAEDLKMRLDYNLMSGGYVMQISKKRAEFKDLEDILAITSEGGGVENVN